MTDLAASLWRPLRDGAQAMFASAGNRNAAQVAYYLVMSFPALLLLVVWGFSTVLEDESVREPIVDAIVQALPIADPTDRREVEQLLDEVAEGAGSLGWLGAVSLLYSASGAIGAIRHAVNEAWGDRDTRPFVPAKALDAGLTVVVAPVAIVALGLTLSGEISSAIGDRPWLAAVAQFAVAKLVPLALLFGLLAWLFTVMPVSRSASFRTAWPGALAGVAGIVAVQVGSGLYFDVFGDANAVYGTMGLLLALVFAAYLIALAVILGAYVSAAEGRPAEGPAGPSQGLGRTIADALRGLFVRKRRA